MKDDEILKIIMEEIMDVNSVYRNMLFNFLTSKKLKKGHLYDEALSAITCAILFNPSKAISAWKNNDFEFYFLRIMSNQIKSYTSTFYKTTQSIEHKFQKKKNKDSIDKINSQPIKTSDVFDQEIHLEELIRESELDDLRKNQLKYIKKSFNKIDKTVEEQKIWELYFSDRKMSYRKLGEELEKNYGEISRVISSLKKRVLEQIAKDDSSFLSQTI